MSDAMRARLLRLLKVPAEPAPPLHDAGHLRVFRAAQNYYRYKLVQFVLGQLGVVAGLFWGLVGLRFFQERVEPGAFLTVLHAGEVLAWGTFVMQAVFGFMTLRLDFEMRWYMLTDRSLRIREGIFTVREKTITFANVQEISIHQNPLQRLLKIADLRVRTAGGGGAAEKPGTGDADESHTGQFRGVERAEEIRDLIRARVRRLRDTGLGDPDEPVTTNHGADSAAGELLAEARALRRVMAGP